MKRKRRIKVNIKVRVREHEYKILKDCFDEIAPDLNLSLVSVEEAYRAPGDDDCESNSTHIIQLETTKERWNEIMDYCLSLEKDVFDENDRLIVSEDSQEYARYAKFDRLWSIMFYIGDMYGIA